MDGWSSSLIGHTGNFHTVYRYTCTRFLVSGSKDGLERLWSALLKSGLGAERGHTELWRSHQWIITSHRQS